MTTDKSVLLLMMVLMPTLLGGCTDTAPADGPGFIGRALDADVPAIRAVMESPADYEVQILFTEVRQSTDGEVQLLNGEYQVRDGVYHYPASTVKLPVALLALEKLSEDERLDRYTRFQVEGEDHGSSFTNELIELFTVSDNQAYNRLFEYLGKDEINRRLRDKGIEARISHRLSVPDSDVLSTRPVTFSAAAGPVVVGPIANQPIEKLELAEQQKGVAYFEDGEKINQPFDFSEKNYLPLRSLHSVMLRLVVPAAFPEAERFKLVEADRQFVLKTMARYPREVGYDEIEYPDGYAKFLILGDRQQRAPERFTIHNKSGWAYGYLTDSAWIVDHEQNREYIITASIHVNANQTFNDDEYEYDDIGVPFLAELGRQLVGY